MKILKKRTCRVGLIALMALLAVGSFAMSAEAVLSYSLNNVFSGFIPVGATPYATASFQTVTTGTVTLTLTNLLGSGQFITEWDFNQVGPTIVDLTFANVSGATATVTDSSDCCQADGDGIYDIQFQFASGPPASRFTAGTSVYTITGTGITENTFLALSTPAGGAGPFHTAAHVQGIPNTSGGSTCSGWISDTVAGSSNTNTSTCGASVAEPSVLLFSGLGLAFVGGLWRRMRHVSTRPV